MTRLTALKKIKSLTVTQLEHNIQLVKIDIRDYKKSSCNYPKKRESCRNRYFIRLEKELKQFEDRLSVLTENK